MHALEWFLIGVFTGAWLGWIGFGLMDMSGAESDREEERHTIDLTHDHGGTPHDV